MPAHFRRTAAHRLLMLVRREELLPSARLALMIGITPAELAEYELGDRGMELALQWQFATVVAAVFAKSPKIKSRAFELLGQLKATKAFHAGETKGHGSPPRG
jgi:hypothetical protein